MQKNTGGQSTSEGPVLEEMGTDQALMKIIQKTCKAVQNFFEGRKDWRQRQCMAKKHQGCTTVTCHNKMERAGSSMSTIIVTDPGSSTATPVKPYLKES